MWPVVLDWATRYAPDAAHMFVQHRQQARELRNAGKLPDSHTMTSWALAEARAQIARDRQRP